MRHGLAQRPDNRLLADPVPQDKLIPRRRLDQVPDARRVKRRVRVEQHQPRRRRLSRGIHQLTAAPGHLRGHVRGVVAEHRLRHHLMQAGHGLTASVKAIRDRQRDRLPVRRDRDPPPRLERRRDARVMMRTVMQRPVQLPVLLPSLRARQCRYRTRPDRGELRGRLHVRQAHPQPPPARPRSQAARDQQHGSHGDAQGHR